MSEKYLAVAQYDPINGEWMVHFDHHLVCPELIRGKIGPFAIPNDMAIAMSEAIKGICQETPAEPAPKKEEEKGYDFINPNHYKHGDLETIEVIEAQGWGREYCLGNALKYLSRAGSKPGESEEKDLNKVLWYVNRRLWEIEQEKKE